MCSLTNRRLNGRVTPYVSVLIPARRPGPQFQRVLGTIFEQRVAFPFEVVVVDSGSTADELEIMRRFPIVLHHLEPRRFRQGRTRNLLAGLARGEVLLFVSQDAEPCGPDWMATLAAAVANRRTAGAYARQVPHHDADPLIRFFLAETYPATPSRRRSLDDTSTRPIDEIFFSNVSSAIRRDVWQSIPFRDVIMSEDQWWAYDVLRAGYEIVYEPRACVFHTHRYSLGSLFRRNYQSGASLSGLIADRPSNLARRGLSYVARQALFLVRERRPHWIPYMLAHEATRALAFGLGAARGVRRRR